MANCVRESFGSATRLTIFEVIRFFRDDLYAKGSQALANHWGNRQRPPGISNREVDAAPARALRLKLFCGACSAVRDRSESALVDFGSFY